MNKLRLPRLRQLADPRNDSGFTLIELIVVITIIIVVSAVAMVNFAGSGKKSRDSRRVADLEKIRISLEMARQVGNTYPAALSTLETNYLSKVPVDPKSSSSYRYLTPSNYSYTLDAVMEDVGMTNGAWGSGYNYRVTNP